MLSVLGHCSFKGSGWFWSPDTPAGLLEGESANKLMDKLRTLERRYWNFMLNCIPKRNGRLDDVYINLLDDIGKLWTPDTTRPKLPASLKHLVYSTPIVRATASSGDAAKLIDARQNNTDFRNFVSDSNPKQTIILDLGTDYKNIDIVTLVPNARSKPAPETSLVEKNALECNTYIGRDNKNFKLVATDSWPPNSRYRTINFPAATASYIKIEILKSNGKNAILTEVEIRSSFHRPETRQ